MNGIILTQPNLKHHDEVEELMEKINKLIPVSDTLVRLIKLRAISIATPIKSNRRLKTTPFFTQLKSENEAAFEPLLDLAASVNSVCLEECGKQLNNFWCNSDAKDPNERKQLIDIRSKVNLIHERLNGLFKDSTLPISIRGEIIQIYLSKIGHLELRKEAESNYAIICMLLQSINQFLQDAPSSGEEPPRIHTMELLNLDVLDNRSNAIIGAMIAIELRRLQVEQLVYKDRVRRNKTVSRASIYILIIAICIIILPLITTIFPKLRDIPFFKFFGVFEATDLSKAPLSQRIQFLGIPAAVIIWSFIGSFAAMIHRFNRRSVYYFDDAIKWMITRHVQGIVLSSAFYLILVSGLFLISGNSSSQSSIKDEVILVLSFLIGFSDRFVDSVFNTLIERYSGKSPEPKPKPEDQTSE